MIYLSSTTPLGTGRHRKCYAHPENPALCIKIVYNFDKGGDKELKRELRYYTYLANHLKDWSGLPALHGTIETDIGTGYIYDIVKDYDGNIATSLTEFAQSCHEKGDIRTLRQVLDTLKSWLSENRIVTMNLKPQNILCRRISKTEVVPVVVDNIGEATLLPMATWSSWFCKKKQMRQWKRFMQNPLFANIDGLHETSDKTPASFAWNTKNADA